MHVLKLGKSLVTGTMEGVNLLLYIMIYHSDIWHSVKTFLPFEGIHKDWVCHPSMINSHCPCSQSYIYSQPTL